MTYAEAMLALAAADSDYEAACRAVVDANAARDAAHARMVEAAEAAHDAYWRETGERLWREKVAKCGVQENRQC